MSIKVVTFGCRLNAAESEVMGRDAAAAGLDRGADGGAEGEVFIVNTCAVTGEAERQARQAIRRLRRERPGARIVVTGCAAEIDPQAWAMREVDRVIGNAAKMRRATWDEMRARFAADFRSAAEAAPDFGVAADEKVAVDGPEGVRETAGHLVAGLNGRTRAYVRVQNGCDHRCTFCIIPFGRGASRSVPAGAVVQEIARLAAAGCREAVLTGVDLTSWGSDLPGTPRLGALVRQILKAVPALPRLRLSSLDCIEIDPELMAAFAHERVMPHLHLSLQAGSDLILKRMKRRHLRADAIKLCRELRAIRPDIALGADFIAGFPTESEDMFRDTLDLVEECGLTHLHVFPYSPRPGTPAARMPPVARAVIKERAGRLRAQGAAALHRRLGKEVGAVRQVLVEDGGRGYSEHFLPVRFEQAAAPGTILAARITARARAGLMAAPL